MSRVTGRQDKWPSPDLPVTELGLPARIRNILLRAGFNTAGEVLAALNRGDETLTSLEGFGPRSLSTLKACLQEHGFPIPTEAPPPLDSLAATLARELQELIAMEREEVPERPVSPPSPPLPAREAVLPAERPAYGKALPLGYLFVGVLILAAALLLLSLSLLGRLGVTGYETLDATRSAVSHPDGVTLRVDEGFTGRLRVRLSSIPRLNLLEGSAGRELRRAVETLPPHLTVKSPLYQFQVRGRVTQPVAIDVLIPNDAEPWETLDLYTWNGQSWEWVGGELHTEEEGREFLRARVEQLPANVTVMQTGAPPPHVSVTWEAGDNTVEAASGQVDEVNPLGLLLGLDGGFTGDPNALLQPAAGAAYEVLPRLRNWAPDGTVNRGLLLDVLTLPEIQDAHIANLVQLCRERGYAGVELDYRGVEPEEREAYARFVAALAGALHAEGKRLSVVVERPTAVGDGWDTGGYDWKALGAAADVLKVPFPASPEAYEEGGEAQRLLAWAVAQVNRYKLHMLVSSLSVEAGDGERYLSLEEALAPFGRVVVRDGSTKVEPGGRVTFGLEGSIRSITYLEGVPTYRLEYTGEDGGIRTVWLGSGGLLGRKLEWARRYHLGGVAIADLLDPGNAAGVLEAVAAYSGGGGAVGGGLPEVVWTVASPEAVVDRQVTPLTQPDYTWVVLAAEGEYRVQATIAGFDHGALSVQVITPRVEVTPTVAVTVEETPEECLGARYLLDVTVPDYTLMERGQVFIKTWRVQNSGSCDWPADTELVRVYSRLGGAERIPVGAVAAGQTVEISIELTAPEADGTFDGLWVLWAGGREIPGGKLTAVIRVGTGEGGSLPYSTWKLARAIGVMGYGVRTVPCLAESLHMPHTIHCAGAYGIGELIAGGAPLLS